MHFLHLASTAIPQLCKARNRFAIEPDKCLDGGNVPDACCQRVAGMSHLVAYVDGGSRGNPGPAAIGIIIDHPEGQRVRIAKSIGHQDNNVAEYVALLEALQYALSRKAKALHVYSDSQVMVRQMKGEYKCRSSRLYSLNWICRKLARSLDFSISHVPRENNAEANDLVNSVVHRRPA